MPTALHGEPTVRVRARTSRALGLLLVVAVAGAAAYCGWLDVAWWLERFR